MASSTSNYQPESRYKDTKLPNFAGRKCYVLQGAMFGLVVSMLAEAGCKRADNVADADFVVFTGGTDVSPSLYNEEKIPEVYATDLDRDKKEEAIYRECLRQRKPMFGICRGAQFLHVMCGGSLWQHVTNHGKQHDIYDIDEDQTVVSSSLHHQMMKYNDAMTLIAVCSDDVTTVFKNENYFIDYANQGKNPSERPSDYPLEVEACYYEKEKCLCIQGHPEIGPAEFKSWSLNKLLDFIYEWEPKERTQEIQKSIIDRAVATGKVS